MKKEDYPKNILTIDQQLTQLIGRGLVIEDEDLAKQFLKNISYFRLQGFWWELQSDKKNHKFKEGTNFTQIADLYTFDRKLRLLVFDAIERVEIAMRTKLIYFLSLETKNWWWYEDGNLFHNNSFFVEAIKDIDKELTRTKEVFAESHVNEYGVDNRPPAYKTLELLSLGCLSKIYSNLNNNVPAKDRIAKEFGLPNNLYLESWLLSTNTVRNIAAHHSRLWNRNIHFAPRKLGKPKNSFIEIPDNVHSLYHVLSCILYMCNVVSSGHSLKDRLVNLLESTEVIDILDIGFPENWKDQPLWKPEVVTVE